MVTAETLLFLTYECAVMPVHTGGGHHALVQCGHQLGLHSEWHYVAPGLAGARGGLMCSGSGTGFRCTPRPHSHGCRRTGAAGIIVSQAHSHDILVAMLASVHAPFCHYPGYTVGITAVFAPSLLPQSRPTRSESLPSSPSPWGTWRPSSSPRHSRWPRQPA